MNAKIQFKLKGNNGQLFFVTINDIEVKAVAETVANIVANYDSINRYVADGQKVAGVNLNQRMPEMKVSTLSSPEPSSAPAMKYPNCFCGLRAEVHHGISPKNNQPYARFVCPKPLKDETRCALSQWLSDQEKERFFAAKTEANHLPMRDLETENRERHEAAESEEIPF